MAVSIVNSWTVGVATSSGFFFPQPAARPVQIQVTNVAGDWLFALVSWKQPLTADQTSVSIADDAHNWWEPVGPPNSDSPAAGTVRSAIWCAPAARVTPGGTTIIQIAPTGPYTVLTCLILDVSGILPWLVPTAVFGQFNNGGTSISMIASAPSAQAIMFALAAGDNNSLSLTGPGVAWTALPAVTATNGSDHLSDLDMLSGYQVTSGGTSATWTAGGNMDLGGVIAGVIVSAAAPAQPNQSWPVVVTEMAIGAGPQTVPALLSWTPLSARAIGMSVQQGRQYTLSQLQAAQGTMTLDNPDGALIPPGSGPFAGLDSGTPVRRRVMIPALASPHYVAFSGFFKRWPWAMDPGMNRGQAAAELTDIWGYGNGALNTMGIEEYLLDVPYALWPLNDPAGSTGGSNLAPGNSNQLVLVQSKNGTNGATIAWGQNSAALLGMAGAKVTASGKTGPGSGMFQQTLAGTSLNTQGYGYSLVCADQNYPPIAGGVTIDVTFQLLNNQVTGGVVGCTASTVGNLFTTTGSNFPNGTPVTLSVVTGFSLPGGFNTSTVYYVISSSGGNYQLSLTLGGSAVTVTSNGSAFIQSVTPWAPVIFAARNVSGTVIGLIINATSGALLLQYKPAGGGSTLVTIDSTHDYRNTGITHVSVAFNRTSYQVWVPGYLTAPVTGTFSSQLPAAFDELNFCGTEDRSAQGFAWSGYVTLAAVLPGMSPTVRVLNRNSAATGLQFEAACDRVERVLEYASMTGRRWLGHQVVSFEGDLTVSGQDIGGQSAVTAANNIAASTLPALLYVAPTGDIVYRSKLYTWNEPVKWTLGDNVAGGEIPFLPDIATDYDPARVVNAIQLTQLDSQTITVPSGVTASTTVAAIEAASEQQYGDQPYQQTGYQVNDFTSAYNAGSSLVDLANWIANIYAKPRNRIQQVTVNAAANSANASGWKAWAFWAGASVGDMVQVNVRVPTAATSPLFSLVARITQTARQMMFSQQQATAQIACVLDFAPEYQALICDDATRGLLNGTNVLPW